MKRNVLLIIGMMLFLLIGITTAIGADDKNSNIITDIDGNSYSTITIGSQTWTVENLRTTHYNDGTEIPLITGDTEWSNLKKGGYCCYDNDKNENKDTYGALYNWYAINTGKLAPKGWHVPTDAEWDTLQNYLIANGYNYDGSTDSNKIAKSLASQTDWQTYSITGTIGCNVIANGNSGFSALPGGCRDRDGSFNGIGSSGYWWTATESRASFAFNRYLGYTISYLTSDYYKKSCGLSVRLLRDN